MNFLTRRTLLIAGGTTIVVTSAVLALPRNVFERVAGLEELSPTPIFAEDGLAIRGTDPVAFFNEGRPVVGEASLGADWNGARWHFASARNRDAFLATPERFAPQYGGFCAWAVAARGKLYSTQPQNWSIVEGKLYLNFNDDVQHRWEADIPGFIAEADRRWPEILNAA